ncbi:hypothetical protein GW17_00022681 [Ensete ventricosum]|uniref:Uncharacterized protein n=1 Tax=Ensete ventricosum TaxID=4639 RepID=A0A427AVR0_ENSVE|nr:hypothetical protein B296_00023857 [Ensete ventricosum]RWW13591.1 hypothetical protein GW17_00022681 [Ensete ventricosum]RZS02489.1 hypothetical protein BHM03_00032550 [Ensete ventricosum]
MSSRRARSRQSTSSSRITDEQINDLVSKLQAVLPEAHIRGAERVSTQIICMVRSGTDRTFAKMAGCLSMQVSAAKVLQETCNYIRSLHREVDDLSERLTELLATTEASSAQAAIIRSLLM